MSGTAPPRLVPEWPSGDRPDDAPETGARPRLDDGDDRSSLSHVFGAPLVLDRS